jgi:SAM-dependent methyltransferase
LRQLEQFALLPRVTSDCKPWPAGGSLAVCETCGTIQKPADATWRDEIRRIYEAYQIYHLSGGAEQVIFSPDGAPAPRSRMLTRFVVDRLPARNPGRLLDIGCGNGSALANFSALLPGWQFDGSELSTTALPRLRTIPGFGTLHTGRVEGEYDVVSLIHSLEHMEWPADTLADATRLLGRDATVFIEIPDVETSPFDILVADHRTHFTRATLRALAGRMGIAIDFLENTVIPKENTLLGRRGAVSIVNPDPAAGAMIAGRTLAWLAHVLDAAKATAARGAGFGIFGTSISGMWLYGALREQVGFFVDEDASRIGQEYEGRPILSPAQVPAGSSVFVPLARPIADRVVDRLRDRGAIYVAPPALDP